MNQRRVQLTNPSLSDAIGNARKTFYSGYLHQAFTQYAELFWNNPRAWWLAMEAIRVKRMLSPCSQEYGTILFSPNYENNSYQKNLYCESQRFGYQIKPVETLGLDDLLVAATCSERLVFHQHWLKELYWTFSSVDAGLLAIDRHVGILKALKSFGATICWTLHNLIDHDASTTQEKLNNYALNEMVKVSDCIFIHTNGAGKLLSSHCGQDLSSKYHILEHPLYDDIKRTTIPCLPKEVDRDKLQGRRILLFLGMIRPYKGVPDLLIAFQEVARANPLHGMHLIIAGHMSDPGVFEVLSELDSTIREQITLVGRKLEENEMAGLMDIADVSVTPYRKVLTSGSFYLSTTYKKPTVAPRIGMFAEKLRDGETGFLYEESDGELVKKLRLISELSREDLVRVGHGAWDAHKHLTIFNVSKIFFSRLEGAL